MRTVWLGAIALLFFFTSGCRPSGMVLGGKFDKHPVKKIVSLSPGTTEILGALQVLPYLVGRTSNCDYPQDPNIKNAIVVVNGTKPNFEKIISIKPDMIVYDAKLYANEDMSKLQGITLYSEAMNANTVQDLIDYMLKVAGDSDMAMNGSKAADEIYAAVQNAKAAAPARKVRVAILTGGADSYYVAGTDSLLGDVVKICGGETIGPKADNFAKMSTETLIQADPEIILTSEDGVKLASDPRFASISAVKARPRPRVYHVDPSVLLRTGPRIKVVIENLSNFVGQAARATDGGKG